MKFMIRTLLLFTLLSLLPISSMNAAKVTVQQDTYITDNSSTLSSNVSQQSIQANSESPYSSFTANGYRSGNELIFDWRYNRSGAIITRVKVTATVQYKKHSYDANWTNVKTISFNYAGGQGSSEENEVQYYPSQSGTYRVNLYGTFSTTTSTGTTSCVSNTVNYF